MIVGGPVAGIPVFRRFHQQLDSRLPTPGLRVGLARPHYPQHGMNPECCWRSCGQNEDNLAELSCLQSPTAFR